MKLALLKGNRFNPWHLQAFKRLRGEPEVTAFRAESEIQQHFHGRDDGSLGFQFERIFFDTQVGNPLSRFRNTMMERYRGREPRLVPFHDRLQGFDLVQTWELATDWTAQALHAKTAYGVPLSVMVWDLLPFNNEQTSERRELKRRVAAEADAFLVYADRARKMLAFEGVSPERVHRLDPGIDIDVFKPGDCNRSDFGIPDDEFVILFVGWLLPRKGIDFLIQALRELLNDEALKKLKIRLLIVGSGPGKERVEALIDRVGVGENCTFAGALPYDRMPVAYRAADVFVLPSIVTPTWQEQFGMSLIEAIACGLPVVSTMTGAIPEIVGQHAMMCQPSDFCSIYVALKSLMLNPGLREDLGASARAYAAKRFDLDKQAAALSDIYGTLLA